MSAKTRVPIKARLVTAGALLAMFAFGSNASADVVRIHFSGLPGSGYADLTLGAAAAGDIKDPDHAPKAITGASGKFNGAAITGVQALTHDSAPPGEDPSKLPVSYSLFSIPGYGEQSHQGISYDNLFYPTGSPLICYKLDGSLDYPFAGGMFDLMGVMFTLDNGSFVDLWSFGVIDPDSFFPGSPGGLTYGLKLIQRAAGGGYEVVPGGPPPFPLATVSVPEPDFFWLFGAGVLGLFAWRRSVELRKRAARIG